MEHVTRLLHPNLWSKTQQPSVSVLTKEDLWSENVDFEDFAELVWSECEEHGWYNNSDTPDMLCIYVRGALKVAP